MGFPGGSAVKNLPAMQEWQETWVQSLGGEDPLEEGMATHFSILTWRIPMDRATKLTAQVCADHNKLWKILKEMGIPDHLTCLLRNLYAGQEATVRTAHGTTDWFQ